MFMRYQVSSSNTKEKQLKSQNFFPSGPSVDNHIFEKMSDQGVQSMFGGGRDFVVTGGTFTINQALGLIEPGLSSLSQVIAHSAIYDSAERYPQEICHPGTRTEILQEIIEWINDPNPSTSVLWLHGPAGAGKSTIMQTIAENLRRMHKGHYAASFFCLKGHDKCGSAQFLASTLAYQIAVNVPGMRSLVDKAMSTDITIPCKSFGSQLRSLIIEPSLDLPYPPTHTPTIIIDGLDECQTSEVQCDILSRIGDSIKLFNLPFRFLIASRPEHWIRDSFDHSPLFETTKRVDLSYLPQCVARDKAVPLLRAFHGMPNRDHFYTTDSAEMQRATSQIGYIQEPSPGMVFPSAYKGLIPLYRTYNPHVQDHFYTADLNERNRAIRHLRYSDEGIVGYIYPKRICGAIPLFRQYSESCSDHLYTTDEAERDKAREVYKYTLEGITGYILPPVE